MNLRNDPSVSASDTKLATDAGDCVDVDSSAPEASTREVGKARLVLHLRIWMGCGVVFFLFNWVYPGAGIFKLWSFYPVGLWGGIVLLHAVTYVGVIQDEARALVSSGIASSQGGLSPGDVGDADGEWQRLQGELDRVFPMADEALVRLGEAGRVARGELEVGLGHVKEIIGGYGRLCVALGMLSEEGEGDEAIMEAQWAVERTSDGRLRELYAAKLELLRSREVKVELIKGDLERIRVCIEGFLLAAENLQLDAMRFEASQEMALDGSALMVSIERLAEEVAILREVEADLEGL